MKTNTVIIPSHKRPLQSQEIMRKYDGVHPKMSTLLSFFGMYQKMFPTLHAFSLYQKMYPVKKIDCGINLVLGIKRGVNFCEKYL